MKVLKNKKVLIPSIIILVVILFLVSSYFIIVSSLKINGDEKVYISYKDDYIDKGATYNVLGINLTNRIKTSNNIIIGRLGNYKVVYEVKVLFLNIKKIRYVNIIDNIPPVITLTGDEKRNVCPNTEYKEEGYSAIDDLDGDLTDKVIITKIDNGISYEVSDKFGNKERVIRHLIAKDSEQPKLELKGSNTVYVRNGASYYEAGYNVSDNCDTDIKVNTVGEVNTKSDGTYTITYEAIDTAGNKASIKRDVVVYTDNRIGVVYLTFDDGPSDSGSTEIILNTLKNNGVKATFFVTGYGPDYLIKREYDEGHAVALHTYTHDYSVIYRSVDAYFNDLNNISNRVFNITGTRPTVIRFPGGSNNTVSNNYSYGIMNILTKKVVEQGYSYFDWNVSAADAGICYDSPCVYSNVVNYLSKDRINVVLMHDSKMYTANALQDIINYCKSNGFVFDTLSESTYPIRFK